MISSNRSSPPRRWCLARGPTNCQTRPCFKSKLKTFIRLLNGSLVWQTEEVRMEDEVQGALTISSSSPASSLSCSFCSSAYTPPPSLSGQCFPSQDLCCLMLPNRTFYSVFWLPQLNMLLSRHWQYWPLIICYCIWSFSVLIVSL